MDLVQEIRAQKPIGSKWYLINPTGPLLEVVDVRAEETVEGRCILMMGPVRRDPMSFKILHTIHTCDIITCNRSRQTFMLYNIADNFILDKNDNFRVDKFRKVSDIKAFFYVFHLKVNNFGY